MLDGDIQNAHEERYPTLLMQIGALERFSNDAS